MNYLVARRASSILALISYSYRVLVQQYIITTPDIHNSSRRPLIAISYTTFRQQAWPSVNFLLRIQYVTGYWKTDHNVTLGQLNFIGPANSHTHALSMH